MTVEARPDGVDVEEEAPVGHLTQVHQVNLDAGGGEQGQGGANRRINLARDHDEPGTRPHRGRHRVPELRPPGAETLGPRRVLVGQIRPGDGGDLGQARERGDQRVGVQLLEDLDGDDLAGHVQGCQAGRFLFPLARHVTPGHREEGTGDDLQDLLTNCVDQLRTQVLGDRVPELSGYEASVLELKQGHRSFLQVCGALVVIVPHVPKEAGRTQGNCDRYHVIIWGVEPHSAHDLGCRTRHLPMPSHR